MAKSPKDNVADDAKKRAREARRKNRLNSIKNELEGGRIKSFEQIFAIISESRLATELNISFYAFRKKVTDPGEFTVNEIISMAILFNVKFDIMEDFILDRVKSRTKAKVFMD